ncbi:uncharacterized protein LOC131219108 isoform X2 [Magnolia sinica]|uniref:uncharacterized protein LOC131219108 isoform X2 n=1 Tax=Magnolia sinica TaxID=86752 RepID=UPI002658ED57|nr:uncharacterized protein LOC131219108 isoform X2 [Magnolia sinica]
MARALHLLRGIPLLPLRVRSASTPALVFFPSLLRPSLFCTAIDPSHPHENAPATTATAAAAENTGAYTAKDTPQYCRSDNPDYRCWKDREAEIHKDIEPITFLTKDILHSNRYMDGERLTAEDEKAVVERLLAYHPHSEDKIGCGIDSIMLCNSRHVPTGKRKKKKERENQPSGKLFKDMRSIAFI